MKPLSKAIFALMVLVPSLAFSAPNRVTDLKAEATGPSTVVLTWTVPTAAGPLQTNDMRQSSSTISSLNWGTRTQLSEPMPGPQGTKQSMTVSGLNSRTVYYFGLKVQEGGVWSTLSNVVQSTTPDVTRTVPLAWDPVPVPAVVGYTVYIGTQPRVYTQAFATGNVTTYGATGLAWGTKYYFTVTANGINAADESGYANEVTVGP